MKIFLILKLCLLAFLGCDYFTDDTEIEPEASPVAPPTCELGGSITRSWELGATGNAESVT